MTIREQSSEQETNDLVLANNDATYRLVNRAQ